MKVETSILAKVEIDEQDLLILDRELELLEKLADSITLKQKKIYLIPKLVKLMIYRQD